MSQASDSSQSQITESVQKAVRQLRDEIAERVRKTAQDLARSVEDVEIELPSALGALVAPFPSAGAGVAELLEAVTRVDAESTQGGVLEALVEEARRFASRTAFFLIREDGARGWGAQGWGAADHVVDSVHFEATGPWERLAGPVELEADELETLAKALGGRAAGRGMLVPFVLRGRLAGALLAEETGAGAALDPASLQLLVHCAAQSLETLPVAGGSPSPALAVGTGASLPVWSAAAATESTPAEVPSVPEETEPVEPAVDEVAPEPAPAPVVETVAEPELEEPDLETVIPEAPVPEVSIEEPAQVAATPEELSVPDLEPLSAEPQVTEPESEIVEEPEEDLGATAEVALVGDAAESAPESDETAFESADLETAPELEPPAESLDPPSLETLPEASPPESSGFAGPAPVEPIPEPPPAVGQATVRLDVASIQDADAPADLPASAVEPPAAPEPEFGNETMMVGSGFEPPAAPEPVEPTEESAFELEDEDVPSAGDTGVVPTWEVQEAATDSEPADEPVYELEEEAPYELEDDESAATLPSGGEPEVEPSIGQETTPIPPQTPAFSIEPEPEPAPTEVAPPVPEPVVPEPEAPAAPEPAAPEPAAPVSAPPAAAADEDAAGGSEVRPPDDLSGPGLAFARPEEPKSEDDALHEEARRLARLLVSEIKLYNEELIEEGRRDGNIYDRLREDIDRSRQMYQDRIDPAVRGSIDYFQQELVQRLAGGDESLLGM